MSTTSGCKAIGIRKSEFKFLWDKFLSSCMLYQLLTNIMIFKTIILQPLRIWFIEPMISKEQATNIKNIKFLNF